MPAKPRNFPLSASSSDVVLEIVPRCSRSRFPFPLEAVVEASTSQKVYKDEHRGIRLETLLSITITAHFFKICCSRSRSSKHVSNTIQSMYVKSLEPLDAGI